MTTPSDSQAPSDGREGSVGPERSDDRTRPAGGPPVAVVAIGRNEGERLRDCLRSVRRSAERVVYVDSGSSDGSPELAAEEGAVVHELAADRPFSAARGRNEGLALAAERWLDLAYVQFVDGDCLLDEDWLRTGAAFLDEHPEVAMLCGDNEEEFPEASPYNALCAIEWRGAAGEVEACGGNAMVRVAPFSELGGFDAAIAAGEEPELCLRLRRAGWTIRRLAAPMTVHDANMHRFADWWRRAARSGKAYWTGYRKHGQGPERYNRKETLRALVWGGALPLAALASLIAWPPGFLLIAAVYVAKLVRVARRHRGDVERPLRYAGFVLLTNVAEFVGIAREVVRTKG